MNVIVIMADTFRRDHLGCYGNRWIRTPVLDAFAGESVIFDRAYSGSFPTIPNRYDCFTGRFSFPFRGWEPLPADLPTLAETMTQAGYVTQLIFDTFHMMNNGFHFDRGFQGWDWVRGQERDRYVTAANISVRFECDSAKLRGGGSFPAQHLRNTYYWRSEEDRFVAQVMSRACRWLEQNSRALRFFLWIDSFDPHEPWDPPEHFIKPYLPRYGGQKVHHPEYGPASLLTSAELRYTRAAYSGEVTLVDKWIGRVLDKIDELGMRENTAVVFTSDHGFYHGEHGRIGKHTTSGPGWALYEEICRIPLIVRLPGKGPTRSRAIVQPADLMPTILDLCGVRRPAGMHGHSFASVLRSSGKTHRPVAFTCGMIRQQKPGAAVATPVTVTDARWSLIFAPDGREPELYDIANDPKQAHNVHRRSRQRSAALYARFRRFLEEVSAPDRFTSTYGSLRL